MRAIFSVSIAGTNISTALSPILLSLSVSDKAGTHADTASLEIDDTDGRIVMPRLKAPVQIMLGWAGQGMRQVFAGTVDEVRSSGSRGSGRRLSVRAKGVDTTSRAKEGQQRHFDDATVADALRAAGQIAGITRIDVDPALASIRFPYLEMRGESFLHFGERLAREVGGSFRVQGATATMARRAGGYTAGVTAQWGVNLISWDITPVIGRARHKGAKARAWNPETAQEDEATAASEMDYAEADFVRRDGLADKDAAQRAVDGDAATAREAAGGGSVVINGSTDAVPDGMLILSGARPGIDGTYRIKAVTHEYSRGGWTTTLELQEPQGAAGKDARKASSGTTGEIDWTEDYWAEKAAAEEGAQ